MIICICNRLNEEAVRTAISEGAHTPERVQQWHDKSFNCGRCHEHLRSMIGCPAELIDEAAAQGC